ncbi:MAG: hypothetical protein FGM32_04000 [Candidatus Kapabacteria bacterium]|nr:hypothetical protein [Candidatus Kapabacteria bacterium]
MNAKNIISILAALGIGYLLWIVLKWVLGFLFTVTVALFQIIAIAVIALPLFFLIRNRLTSSR